MGFSAYYHPYTSFFSASSCCHDKRDCLISLRSIPSKSFTHTCSMPLIVVAHPSTFVSYIIALTLLNYYSHRIRHLRILVIEYPQYFRNTVNHDLSPWCGVNTFNSTHFVNKDFMNSILGLICGVNEDVVPLASVRSVPHMGQAHNTHNFNMEKPVLDRLEVAPATINSGSTVGILYHPILLMNSIRAKLLQTGKVSFTSLQPTPGTGTKFDQDDAGRIVRQLAQQQSSQGNELMVVVKLDQHHLNFVHEFMSPEAQHPFLVNSNLSSIHFTVPPPTPYQISAALWLPKFKALSNIKEDPLHTSDLQYQHLGPRTRVVNLTVKNMSYHPVRDRVIVNLDVFAALGVSDYVLHAIDRVMLESTSYTSAL